MRKLTIWIACVLLLIAAISLCVSFHLAEHPKEFWSNFLLHIVAECLALTAAAFIAYIYAGKKLDELAWPIVDLIKQMRIDNKISSEAARRCVVCAVKVISEGHLRENRLSGVGKTMMCPVCALEVGDETAAGSRCQHCGLSGSVWKR